MQENGSKVSKFSIKIWNSHTIYPAWNKQINKSSITSIGLSLRFSTVILGISSNFQYTSEAHPWQIWQIFSTFHQFSAQFSLLFPLTVGVCLKNWIILQLGIERAARKRHTKGVMTAGHTCTTYSGRCLSPPPPSTVYPLCSPSHLLWFAETTAIHHNISLNEYTAKLLFHQSPTRHSHYTMTRQWLCSDCWQQLAAWWLSCQWQCSHGAASSCQQSLNSYCPVIV